MATLIVIGLIAWVLTGAVEDTIRAGRGDAPAGPRRGFRGYLDDRWAALADRHHANKSVLDGSEAPGWLTRKRLEGRRKALALGGFRTDEEIERAAVEHRRRLGLIRQGIDPDEVADEPEKRRAPDPDEPAEEKEEKEEKSSQPEDDLDTTDVPGLTDLGDQPDTESQPTEPIKIPWTPYADTEPKENTNMTAGEITSPADVKAFAAAMSASLNATTSTVDTLNGITAGLANRVTDHAANALAAENAAAGMTGLGMHAAAAAARALIEQQQQIQTAMQTIVDTIAANAAAIADAVEAARPSVAAIESAYAAQLAVADTRQGVGTGNLAADKYLDADV